MSDYVPKESERDAYGTMAAQSHFTNAILGSAFLAVQWFIVLSGLSTFLQMPKDLRRGRLRFILISWFILITSSTDTILDIRDVFHHLYAGGPTGTAYMRALKANRMGSLATGVLSDAMLVACIAAGDILMLWRCWILWAERKWLICIPTLTCIGSIVCQVLYLVWMVIGTTQPSENTNRLMSKGIMSAVSLSVAMNVMVTVLIIARLAQTWRHTAQALNRSKSPQMYSGVVGVIVESAAPLAIFGICFLAARSILLLHPPEKLIPRGRIYAFDIVSNGLYSSFCALAPQMIIARVTSGKSWRNAEESQGEGISFSQPIQFARPGMETKISSLTEDA